MIKNLACKCNFLSAQSVMCFSVFIATVTLHNHSDLHISGHEVDAHFTVSKVSLHSNANHEAMHGPFPGRA